MIKIGNIIRDIVVLHEGAEDKINRLSKSGELSSNDKLLIHKYENIVDWNAIKDVVDFKSAIANLISSGADSKENVDTIDQWIDGMESINIDNSLIYLVKHGIMSRYGSSNNLSPKGFIPEIFEDVIEKHPFKNYKTFENQYNYALRNYIYNRDVKNNIIYTDSGGGQWVYFKPNHDGDYGNRIGMNILSASNWCIGKSLKHCSNTYAKYDFFFRINPKTKQADVSIRRNPSGKLDEWSGTIGDLDQELTENEEKYKDEFEANYLFKNETLANSTIAGELSDSEVITNLENSEIMTIVIDDIGPDGVSDIISKLNISKSIIPNIINIFNSRHSLSYLPVNVLNLLNNEELYDWAVSSVYNYGDGSQSIEHYSKLFADPKFAGSLLAEMLFAENFDHNEILGNISNPFNNISDDKLIEIIGDIVSDGSELDAPVLAEEVITRGLEEVMDEHDYVLDGTVFFAR